MSDQASDLEGVREETKSTVDPIKSFLSGGFGGIACVLVGHPFDLTYVAQPSEVENQLIEQKGEDADCFSWDL